LNQLLKLLLGLGVVLTEPRKRRRAQGWIGERVDDFTDEATKGYENAVDRIGRLYHSVRGDDNRVLTYAVSFLAGVGVGATAGLLLAPASGEETRAAIADKAEHFQNAVRERFSEASGRATSA